VQANSYTLTVYDETGHALGSFPASAGAWSPNGDRIASLTPSRKALEVRTGGVGPPTLRHAASGAERLGWLGSSKLRLYGQNGWFGFDVTRARPVRLPSAYRTFGSVTYVDGTKAVAELFGRARNSLVVTDLSGRTNVLATALPCPEANAFADLQFIPGGRFVIYASACPAPPSDIYSVASDGSGLHRLTTSVHDDTQPAVSPNAGTIAYVEVDNAVKCSGCPSTVWLMNADGTAAHPLPNAADTPFDDYPSFSPDGSQLLFVRGGPSSQHLFIAPVSGSAAVRDLGITGSYPAWGPERIAFDGEHVLTAAPDGTDRRPVMVRGRAVRGIPAWSAAGRLAVLGSEGRSVVISIADPGGAGRRISLRGLQLPFAAGSPAWSPDGKRIAFTAVDSAGVGDVWTVGEDGRGLRRLTHDLGALSSVAWR
jgi:Tol biopolymer transport system component